MDFHPPQSETVFVSLAIPSQRIKAEKALAAKKNLRLGRTQPQDFLICCPSVGRLCKNATEGASGMSKNAA